MHDHAAASLAHRSFQGVEVQRFDAGHVDDLGGYAPFGQRIGGLEGFQDAGAPADQGQVAAFAQGETAVQGQAPAVVEQGLRVHAVEPGRFEKNHRVRIIDCRQQQAIRPRRRGRHHHAQSRCLRKHGLGAFAMVLRRTDAGAHG
ncbi:hypothetical protein D3C85_833110 [compost metagenome]